MCESITANFGDLCQLGLVVRLQVMIYCKFQGSCVDCRNCYLPWIVVREGTFLPKLLEICLVSERLHAYQYLLLWCALILSGKSCDPCRGSA